MAHPRTAKITHWCRLVAAAAITSVVWLSGACSKPPPSETPLTGDFDKRITAYLDLQKRVTADLPPLKKTDDPVEISGREVAFGAAIRAARTGVPPGDILAPDIAAYFRKVIKEDFRSRTKQERELIRDEIPTFSPAVNQTYPSDSSLATFPATLLTILPALPEGLEYRLLSNALIIRDVKANIIVDFILDVF